MDGNILKLRESLKILVYDLPLEIKDRNLSVMTQELSFASGEADP
jgi:hypothetical protein